VAIDRNEEIRRADFPFYEELKKTKYPVRALRYWWMHCVIQDELKRMGKPMVIADVGCDRGIIKRFIPPVKNARWIGLDIDTNREGIGWRTTTSLSAVISTKGFLTRRSVDIAICSHVLEHLPRPDFTFKEIARILRPAECFWSACRSPQNLSLLSASASLPDSLKKASAKSDSTSTFFWVNRLRRMCEQIGLHIEFATGTALVRKKAADLKTTLYGYGSTKFGRHSFHRSVRNYACRFANLYKD
jgi:SAM-dependent methyltransferase